MRKVTRITTTIIILACSAGSSWAKTVNITSSKSNDSFRIAGYLPDYRFDGIDWNKTVPLIDDLYLFSMAPQTHLDDASEMFSGCCLQDWQFVKARHARAQTSIDVWVTIGGGGRSDHFTRNPDVMIQAILLFASQQQIQGIDFDCESFTSRRDYDDYLSLIRKAIPALHKSHLFVSVALHAGQTLPKDLYETVDRINLMAYDMGGAAYHADFSLVQNAVQLLIRSGCKPSKIFLGIPAYGRHKQNMQQVKTYRELADAAIQVGTTIEELNSQSELEGYKVDSPYMVMQKSQWAQNTAGLGGVFLWELGQDHRDMLLLTAAASVKNNDIHQKSQSTKTVNETPEL
jgi:GH18 family chitinase